MQVSTVALLQVRNMGRHTNPRHRSQPAQEPGLPYTRETVLNSYRQNSHSLQRKTEGRAHNIGIANSGAGHWSNQQQ